MSPQVPHGPRRASMVYMPTCQLLICTCQRTNKCANVPNLCQLFNLACQHFKGVPIFQIRLPKGFFKRIFQLLNFSIMLNICKFRKYLGNSRKLISLNKEFKLWHFQNFINLLQSNFPYDQQKKMNPAENVIFLTLKRRSNCNCSVTSSFLVILGNVAQKQHWADKGSLGKNLVRK